MRTLLLDALIGYTTAVVPTQVITSGYLDNLKKGEDVTDLKHFDYVGTLKSTPLFFALINVFVMMGVDRLYKIYGFDPWTRFITAGVVIALIYSNIGRFYLQIPQKVLKMEDPIWFNIYAVITWVLVYFVVYLVRDRILECRECRADN